MILDHMALRVASREAASKILLGAGYRIAQEFEIPEIGARSYALVGGGTDIFISEGDPGSIIDLWVKERGNGLHHIAHSVQNIYGAYEKWVDLGITFQTRILECPCDEPLRQVFTEEQSGLVHELIERNGHPGFCLENVRRLMSGTEM